MVLERNGSPGKLFSLRSSAALGLSRPRRKKLGTCPRGLQSSPPELLVSLCLVGAEFGGSRSDLAPAHIGFVPVWPPKFLSLHPVCLTHSRCSPGSSCCFLFADVGRRGVFAWKDDKRCGGYDGSFGGFCFLARHLSASHVHKNVKISLIGPPWYGSGPRLRTSATGRSAHVFHDSSFESIVRVQHSRHDSALFREVKSTSRS